MYDMTETGKQAKGLTMNTDNTAEKTVRQMDYATYFDKVYGCWLGKCICGSIGAPLEGCKQLFDYAFDPAFWLITVPRIAPAMPQVQSVSKPLLSAISVACSRSPPLLSRAISVMPMFSNIFVQSGWP